MEITSKRRYIGINWKRYFVETRGLCKLNSEDATYKLVSMSKVIGVHDIMKPNYCLT
jgi:hypothetical protein